MFFFITAAEISRRMLRTYKNCVLWTDRKNPTSNKIYEALGYKVVAQSQSYTFF